MPRAKLSDAQPVSAQQSGSANLSDTTSGGGDAALRAKWKGMSKEQKDSLLASLDPHQRIAIQQRLGEFDSKLPIGVSAPPKFGTVPWMKQKALSFVNAGANQLPTVLGAAGGLFGTGVGEGLNPAGGGIPGAIIGSDVGGTAGDAARQVIQHATGYDQFEAPEDKTLGARTWSAAKEGAEQAAGEISGQLLGTLIRPTLDRSLAKLYYAGGLKYGDPLGRGDLESVIHDVMATEKSGQPAVTVRDFYGVLNQAKKDIGQEVDLQYALPVTQNGVTTMLGKAKADSTPIVNAITSKAIADPSIVKMAKLNPAGKEAAYLERIRREALNFSREPWTYEELTDRRIKLNQELAPLYELPAGEQRVYLLDRPDLAYKKAEAEAIREVVYPQMDHLANNPPGTTAQLQNRRGALMSLETQVENHLGNLKTKARQAKGAPMTEKANISTYGTSSGKPGIAMHRLSSLVHTPNPERAADKKVAQAFGNTVGSKIRSAISSPRGSAAVGNELLSMPLRELVNPAPPPRKEDDEGTPDNQSSAVRPRDLIDKARQLNPAAQGQTAYDHVAVNPDTGHKIGSKDGRTWYDLQTGAKVA
jgi:hypothetical protein